MRETKVTAREVSNGNFSKAVIPFRRNTASREVGTMQPFRERGMQRLVNDRKSLQLPLRVAFMGKGQCYRR